MATEMVQVKVRVPVDQREWLDEESERRGVSTSAIVRAALVHYREVMPPAPPTGAALLDSAVARLDE